MLKNNFSALYISFKMMGQKYYYFVILQNF